MRPGAGPPRGRWQRRTSSCPIASSRLGRVGSLYPNRIVVVGAACAPQTWSRGGGWRTGGSEGHRAAGVGERFLDRLGMTVGCSVHAGGERPAIAGAGRCGSRPGRRNRGEVIHPRSAARATHSGRGREPTHESVPTSWSAFPVAASGAGGTCRIRQSVFPPPLVQALLVTTGSCSARSRSRSRLPMWREIGACTHL